MTTKELAKAIDSLTKEEVEELIIELKLLGYTAAEPVFIEREVEEAVAEKTNFKITLLNPGGRKLEVIKYWKANSSLSLMESKSFIESAPVVLKSDMSEQEAKDLKKELEDLGAEVSIS